MNKLLFLSVLGLVLFVPGVTHAAFNFGSVSSDQIYLEQEQNAIVVNQTRTSAAYDFNPPAGVTCESEAQQAGLSESNNYWCVQKPVLGTIGSSNCVFLCQVGVGSGSIPGGPSTAGRMITYILSSAPVGHPLSYFNNASQSQQSAMYDSMMCMGFPSFGIGCELKKHVPANAPPTAALAANPTSVVSGSSAVLTWSSTNATSCTGTGFSTGGATSGSVSTGALSASTDYSITCMATSVTAAPGTWDLAQSDISDMACPITNNNNVYSGVARCPANPQGKTCSGEGSGSVCRVNTLSNEGVGGGGCYVYTDIYTCKQSSGAPTAPSATAYASVAVTPVVQQTATNLTAGAITPTTATQGTSVTLSSLITNAGTLLTPTGFTNLFQIDSDADHNAVTTTSTDTSPALAPSAGDTSQVSYTFPTVGTWYVRACADSNASWVSTITESNEADNCGPWTAVTVSSSCTGASCLPDGSILSCSASPTTITAGGSSTWSASKSGLGTYTWTPSETGTPTSGAQTLSRTYSSAGTYAMSVSAGGATASCTNSVTVGKQACGVAVPSISASPTRVQTGGTSTLTVSASGVDGTCTITGPGVSQTISSGTSCTVPSTTIPTGAITSLSTYTISCDSGEASAKVLVNVVPKIQEF